MFFCFLMVGFAVAAQSVSELDARRGFKEIKLGSDIKGFPEFKEVGVSSHNAKVQLYEYLPDSPEARHSHIGDIRIFKIKMEAYEGKVFQVQIWLPYKDHLLPAYQKAFGNPQEEDARDIDSYAYTDYLWHGKEVELVFRHVKSSRIDDIVLSYKDKAIAHKIMSDLQKKKIDIHNDF